MAHAIIPFDQEKWTPLHRSCLYRGNIEAYRGGELHQRDLSAFGIDEALDLIRRVSGGSDDEGLANSVTGSTALKFTKEMDLTEIGEVDVEALIQGAPMLTPSFTQLKRTLAYRGEITDG
ncbi:DUF6119 family protein [Rhizobium mongolense]|uniref:DUF6119 family protein n=1 Tax=Rhizobium mongolense TaxID=57676 RepID=UPI0028AB7ACD|nr:DUF6119 family protein [Rhizobium mongolense]